MIGPPQRLVVRSASSGALLRTVNPCAQCKYADAVWSPNGASLGFIASDEQAEKTSLYVLMGEHLDIVATIEGTANTLRWSPDGKTLSLLVTQAAHKKVGAAQAGTRQIGEIGESSDEQRLATISTAGGELRLVSPEDLRIRLAAGR